MTVNTQSEHYVLVFHVKYIQVYTVHNYSRTHFVCINFAAFCKQNCAKIGERGCESCKEGFESVPECCRKLHKSKYVKQFVDELVNDE